MCKPLERRAGNIWCLSMKNFDYQLDHLDRLPAKKGWGEVEKRAYDTASRINKIYSNFNYVVNYDCFELNYLQTMQVNKHLELDANQPSRTMIRYLEDQDDRDSIAHQLPYAPDVGARTRNGKCVTRLSNSYSVF